MIDNFLNKLMDTPLTFADEALVVDKGCNTVEVSVISEDSSAIFTLNTGNVKVAESIILYLYVSGEISQGEKKDLEISLYGVES